MALRGGWRKQAAGAVAAALVGGVLGGCDKGAPTQEQVKPGETQAPTVSIETGAANDGGSDVQGGLDEAKAGRLNQPFADACTMEVNADSGVALPPTTTFTGKNTGQLNEAIQKLWDQIQFTVDGKPQTYVLEFQLTHGQTDLGTIEVLMRPEIAPNHARNFVALAMLHYYDGLHIDRVVRQQAEDQAGSSRLVLLEGGSPVEDADPAASHLGYWLKPEFSDALKHEEGTVGACLLGSEDNTETAACRFYLNLTPAPAMDGNYTAFGKVIKGMDVARRIADLPVREKDGGPDQGRPVTPVVIQKVTARAVPVVE